MANTLQYILSLNDQMSSKLSKIGISSDNALNKFAKLQQQSSRTSQLMKDMGGSVGALREKLSLLKNERDWIPEKNIQDVRRYNREIQNLETHIEKLENTGSKTKGWMSDAFSQIPFAGLLTNPLVIAGAIGGKAISLGIEDEMQKTSFTVLLGGEKAAKQLVDDIAKYADKTPFEKMGLGDAAKTMLGFGIAQEKVMPDLKMLGDVAMGDANKLQSLALAFSQISSAGKMQGQDLLQLINAGFNPLQEISKNTGVSMANLKKEMEKGNISFKMVEQAFSSATGAGGKFHGMADKMSETVGGKWSSAIDSINRVFLKLYNIISPILIPAINLLVFLVEGIVNVFSYLYNQIAVGNPIFLGLAITLGIIGSALAIVKIGMIAQNTMFMIGMGITNIFTASWWRLNMAMFANPIVWIVAGIIALIAVIGYVIYKTDGWGKMWSYTMKAMSSYWDFLIGGLKLGWMAFTKSFMWGIDLIRKAWYKLKGLWDKDGAQKGLDQINKQAQAREKAFQKQKEFVGKSATNTAKYTILAASSLKWNDKKTLGGLATSMKDKLGLNSKSKIGKVSEVPGTAGIGKLGKNGALGDGLKKNNESIVTGGTKSTVITINVKNLVENLSVAKDNLKDSTQEIEKHVMDALLRVLAMAQTVG